MLENLNLEKVLFLDIETAAQHPNFEQLDDTFKQLWETKSKSISKEDETPEEAYSRAGIYAEFGKIICISVGFVRYVGGSKELRLKSFFDKSNIPPVYS